MKQLKKYTLPLIAAIRLSRLIYSIVAVSVSVTPASINDCSVCNSIDLIGVIFKMFVRCKAVELVINAYLMAQIILSSTQFYNDYFISKIRYLCIELKGCSFSMLYILNPRLRHCVYFTWRLDALSKGHWEFFILELSSPMSKTLFLIVGDIVT